LREYESFGVYSLGDEAASYAGFHHLKKKNLDNHRLITIELTRFHPYDRVLASLILKEASASKCVTDAATQFKISRA
jgi:hypothetical protein